MIAVEFCLREVGLGVPAVNVSSFGRDSSGVFPVVSYQSGFVREVRVFGRGVVGVLVRMW
jgi:hypothetical protein